MTSRDPLVRRYLAASFSSLLACAAPPAPDDADAPEPVPVCAATPGGDGGPTGSVHVASGAAADRDALAQRFADLVVASPGPGGHGGLGDLADDASDGAAGPVDGMVDVAAYPDYAFDGSTIEPDARIEIVASGENVIALTDAGDPPLIAVQDLVIRSGATLALSCDVRIVAARVVIEQGATLTLQSRNEGVCTLAIGSSAHDPGQRGAIATIETATLELHGTIDLSGSDGAPAAAGGAGGGLTVIAEEIVLGDAAVIDVSGGAGGDGVDEAEC